MKVSLNWIRFLNDKYHCAADPAPDGVQFLVEKIGAQLGAVEEVIDLGKKYRGIVIVKVLSAEKHPNADKLSVCMVDTGKAKPVQVVCGAPNVKAGQLAVWIPPGAAVPSTLDKDPFVIEARDIRGVTSHGMLASAKELGLGDDHTGIVQVEEDVKPGDDFASTYGLDDYIIDIENKMFTHRPDLFGQLGIAREIAGIQHQVFKGPPWYRENADINIDGRSNGLKLEIKNLVPKLVPRFCAIAIKDVKVLPSPVWLQARLNSVGIRPINNIVDLTNFFMMETAQPLHAYDYDKVKTGVLGVRMSKKGEQLTLLGGKEIKLDAGAVVITNGTKPIGLGGIMGGADTEVDENTKNIILECANFDMNQTRKSAMEYGLFTDAATRFTKNQNPRQNRAVIAKAVEDILNLAGGRVAGKLIDEKSFSHHEITVKTDPAFINSRLGSDMSAGEMKKLLENVEFTVKLSGEKMAVTVPFWRTDIEIPEDLVEEVGRLYGYDKLSVMLPRRDLSPANRNGMLDIKSRVREVLKSAGANEVLTYSFTHENLLKKAGQDPAEAFHIRNALSPDLQYYRLSLTPSLLDKVHPNIRAGFDEYALFEIGKAHGISEAEDGLPKEFDRLSLVVASKNRRQGADFYEAKNYIEFLAKELNLNFRYEPLETNKFKDHKLFQQMINVYEPKRSALIFAGEKLAGAIGEFPANLRQSLKLPASCAGAELFFSPLQDSPVQYHPINRFPELEQDFCLRSSAEYSYGQLTDFMSKHLLQYSEPHGYSFKIEPLDIYQKSGDEKHKQTTWRIILWHPQRTLTTEETNKLLDQLADEAKKELNAERI